MSGAPSCYETPQLLRTLHIYFALVALLFATATACKATQIEDKTLPIVVYYALPG